MSGPEEQFHDPELKEAIVRLRGGHRMRPDLRATILQRLEEQRREMDAVESDNADARIRTSADAVAELDTPAQSEGSPSDLTVSDLAEPQAAAVAEPDAPTMRLTGDAAELKAAEV